MPRIEWQEEKIFEPTSAPLEEFCAANEIRIGAIDNFRTPRVFVSENVLGTMQAHLESDLDREQGGILIGQPFYDPGRGRYFVDIHAAIPAYAAVGTPAHLQFTAESWAYISPLIDRQFPGQVVVAGITLTLAWAFSCQAQIGLLSGPFTITLGTWLLFSIRLAASLAGLQDRNATAWSHSGSQLIAGRMLRAKKRFNHRPNPR